MQITPNEIAYHVLEIVTVTGGMNTHRNLLIVTFRMDFSSFLNALLGEHASDWNEWYASD